MVKPIPPLPLASPYRHCHGENPQKKTVQNNIAFLFVISRRAQGAGVKDLKECTDGKDFALS